MPVDGDHPGSVTSELSKDSVIARRPTSLHDLEVNELANDALPYLIDRTQFGSHPLLRRVSEGPMIVPDESSSDKAGSTSAADAFGGGKRPLVPGLCSSDMLCGPSFADAFAANCPGHGRARGGTPMIEINLTGREALGARWGRITASVLLR